MNSQADRTDVHVIKGYEQVTPTALPLLKINRLLLCTDFSPAARGAFEATVHLCRYTRSKVTAVHVREFGPMPATTDEGMDYIDGLYAERERKLLEVVKELRASGVESEALSLDGNAPSLILEEIERAGYDLVVMGTHATHGLERLIFGSTAEAVFRKATCPVMTVGAHGCLLPSPEGSASIVFATDFREHHGEAVKYAAGMANRFRSVLHCVHVLPLSDEDSRDPAVEETIREALSRLTHQGGLCELPPVYDVLYGSDVSHAIVEYAKAQKALAIVLGVRRKTRVAAHLPPHRTYRMIMTAQCPVLTLSEEGRTLSIGTACF